MIDSHTPSEERGEPKLGHLDRLLDTLSGNDRDILWQYLLSAPYNEQEQSTLDEPYGDAVRKLARQYKCSLDVIRNTLMIRLETDEFDDEDDEEEEQRKTAQWSLHPSAREPAESVESVSEEGDGLEIGDRKTVSFGRDMDDFVNQPTVPSPASSKPIESYPPSVSKELPKAVITKEIPNADMSPQEFISNRIDAGKWILGIILNMEDLDIMNAGELSKLERQYEMSGFMSMAFLIIDRADIDRGDTYWLKEILEAEKKAEKKKAEIIRGTREQRKLVVKRMGLRGGALFGKRKKKVSEIKPAPKPLPKFPPKSLR